MPVRTTCLSVIRRAVVLCALLLMAGTAAAFADAELEIEKSVTTMSGSCFTAGDSLSIDARTSALFCYTIRNAGSETAVDLQLIENNGTPEDSSDDFSVPLGLTDLPAHFTLTVQYIYDAETPGVFRHIASLSGSSGSTTGRTVRASDYVLLRVAPVNAQLEITKRVTTPGGSCFTAGDSITVDARSTVLFCYTIENTGKATVSGLELIEDNGTPSDPSDDYAVSLGANTSLAPDVQMIVEHAVTIDEAGEFTHSARVSGHNEGTSSGGIYASDSVVVTAEHVDAVIELTKTVTTSGGSCLSAGSALGAEAGSEVQFCYTIRNAGKAALRNLSITEDNGTPSDSSDDYQVPLGGNGDLLLPQTTVTVSGFRTTPIPPRLGPVDYTATAKGANDGTQGGTVTGKDAVTVTWTDTAPPVITACVDDIRVDNAWGIMGAKVDLPSPTVSDSSGMAPTVHFDPASGSVFPLGTTQVQAIATDAGGNTDTCTFAVTVDYATPPRIRISIPEERGPVPLHSSVLPLFHVGSVAPIDRIETTELPNGVLDTASPGFHKFSVTATDEKGLSSTASVRYVVAYRVGPLGPIAAWPTDWSFVKNGLPAADRVPVGSVMLGGRFAVGEEIRIFFTLRDETGAPQTVGIGQLSIARILDLDGASPDEIVSLKAVPFDESLGGYGLAVSTAGWTPGFYDLWLGLDDTTARRVRIEIVVP